MFTHLKEGLEFLCRYHGIQWRDAKNKRVLCTRLVQKLTSGAASSTEPAAEETSDAEASGGGVPSSGAPSPRMQIFVEQRGGTTITLDVPASYAVRIIKAKIQAVLGIATALQRLTYEGVQLEDGMTLEHYNIHNRSTLFLYVEGEEPEVEARWWAAAAAADPSPLAFEEKEERRCLAW